MRLKWIIALLAVVVVFALAIAGVGQYLQDDSRFLSYLHGTNYFQSPEVEKIGLFKSCAADTSKKSEKYFLKGPKKDKLSTFHALKI